MYKDSMKVSVKKRIKLYDFWIVGILKKKLLKVVHFIILSISNQRWKIYTWIFYIHACSVLMRWFLKSFKRWKVHDRVCR